MAGRIQFLNPETMATPIGYSHVAKVRAGPLVFISGQASLDPSGNVVGPGDYALQAQQTFRNLGLALQAAGADFRSVVKLTIYVLDIRGLPEVRAERDRHVDPAHPPASTAIEVGRLFRPELLLEVDAVACVD
jgi:enamine deaminase RidA (YjgF/YER057c/UK114 family)